jgi:stress response protein YsnF
VAVGEEISEATAIALRRYYGLGDPVAPAEGDRGPADTESLDAGAAVPAAKTTAAMTSASTEPSSTMIRSEEELRVRLRRRARRVRIKRYVVTDYVTTTIPVRREELRLVEALGDEASRTAKPALPGGDGWEMVLHHEEPVVARRVVARERVRLHVQTVTEHRRISGEVRKERIEVDDSSVRD